MTRNLQATAIIAAALVALLGAAPALAQPARTCVSAAKGNDANAANYCDCATPCRQLQVALDQTAAGGEVTVLDPGNYGVSGLTINKAINITNDGVGEAGILAPSGAVVTINTTGTGNGPVNLRGLAIQGMPAGTSSGVRFNGGASLTMTNCIVRNHTGNGIEFLPTNSSQLSVSNTLVSNNGHYGILVEPAAAAAAIEAVFSRVEANNNGAGIAVLGSSNATIRATVADSVAANNTGSGFYASLGPINMMVVRAVVANNGTGIMSSTLSSNIWVGGSIVSGNDVGIWVPNGQGAIYSYGDNNINGNATDIAWPLATVSKR